jgi:imidazolonepropionase
MQGPDAAPQVRLLAGAAQVVTCESSEECPVGVIESGVVAIEGERILFVGSRDEVLARLRGRSYTEVDAAGGTIVPGYVDCHTHLIFMGDRHREYFARNAGMDEAQMRRAGVPYDVSASIAANRGVSVDALVEVSLPRLRRMLANGTTTLETKSGYGLDPESDARSLQAAARLAELLPVEIATTYLGAHVLPPGTCRERYLGEVLNTGIPRMASEGLAEFCDVYCDPNVFSLDETRQVLERAANHGMKLKLHLDAKVRTGGALLAADMRAVSVDHVNYTSLQDMQALAAAGTVAVTFPGFDFVMEHARPFDMSKARQAQLTVALGTDLCPVCWMESMQTTGSFACRMNRMTAEEALLGSTIHAARALGRADRIGSIAEGKQADLLILDVPSYEQATFRFGVNSVAKVFKKGLLVVDNTLNKN